MPKTIQKEKIKVDILPGTMTPAMKTAWRAFWRRLITSVREELDNEEKSNNA